LAAVQLQCHIPLFLKFLVIIIIVIIIHRRHHRHHPHYHHHHHFEKANHYALSVLVISLILQGTPISDLSFL